MRYFKAKTLDDACSLVSQYAGEAKVIAGGTDLLVQMKNEKVMPENVIDIGGISGQEYITYDDEAGLRIGAQATIDGIANSPLVMEKFGLLSEAASRLGSPHIRFSGTIAGNLCNASPAAETAPPLIALGASVKLVRSEGERIVPVEDFFVGPGRTVLESNELVAEVRIPPMARRGGGSYLAQRVRKAEDIAIVSVAAVVALDGEAIGDLKIALGAVGPTPLRARAAEEILRGAAPSDHLIQEAGRVAASEAMPIDDLRASAEYRREIVKVLVGRAVQSAVERARTGQ